MQTIKASDFKAKCLALRDEVARTGEPIQVTRNGRPIVELRPVSTARAISPFGLHKGRIEVLGDIMAPLDPEDWEALK